jgi:hypothetical protein
MVDTLSAILRDAAISPAEYAVLWHVRDTVVRPRDVIADWAADNLPGVVSPAITVDDCLRATDSLIRRALLIELTAADIEADLVRWRTEALPVSWGVDRDRYPADVDLTEAGFHLIESIMRKWFPAPKRSPFIGYNDEQPGMIRVFGETAESCQHATESIVARIDGVPWRWPRDSVQLDAMRPLGPWWYSRFERAPEGFHIVVRRIDRATT